MRMILFFIALMVCAGCGGNGTEKAAEKLVESRIKAETGGDASVDIEQDRITIESREGTVELAAGSAASVPVGFPEDVPVYGKAKIESSLKVPQGFSLVLQTGDSAAQVASDYSAKMAAKGWESGAVMDLGEQKLMAFSKDGRSCNLVIASEEGVTQIVITTAREE